MSTSICPHCLKAFHGKNHDRCAIELDNKKQMLAGQTETVEQRIKQLEQNLKSARAHLSRFSVCIRDLVGRLGKCSARAKQSEEALKGLVDLNEMCNDFYQFSLVGHDGLDGHWHVCLQFVEAGDGDVECWHGLSPLEAINKAKAEAKDLLSDLSADA